MDDYLKGCKFVPKLKNEIPGETNAPWSLQGKVEQPREFSTGHGKADKA